MIPYNIRLSILLKDTMKKGILLFLMILLPICGFSQNTSTITKEQVKTANLIFVEHEELLHKVPLLEQQIDNLEKINKSWEHTDSIREHNEQVLTKQNKKLSKTNKIVSISALFVLLWSLIK